MRDEISAAVHFLARLIGKSENFNQKLLEDFKACLSELLEERFENHWFPDQPFKGQGYRCIRVNGYDRRDATLEQAARTCGIKYEDMKLPIELTIWVDPNEVCCRFGESKGSYCTLASFIDKENNASCGSVSSGDESEAGSEETEAVQLSPPTPLAQQTANENKIQTAVLGGSNNNNQTSNGGGRKGRSKSGGARRHNTTNNSVTTGGGFHHPIQSWYNVLPHQWLSPSPPPYHPMLRTHHHIPHHPHHRYQWSTLKA